jgi:DNA-binding transcriptional ArsR family regulator
MTLAASVGTTHNLIHYHLRPLVAAGLVTSERKGRDVAYRVVPRAAATLAAALLDASLPREHLL